MSKRREELKSPADNRMERIGATVRRRALSGSEASSVGFTLVVYIFAGAGIGYLLDKNLETSYWIAIGMLFGTAVGFREMFRLTSKLTKSIALEDDEPSFQMPTSSQATSSARDEIESEFAAEEESVKPRLFSIPAPPQASFEKRQTESLPEKPVQSTPAAPEESQEEFIERLLDNQKADDVQRGELR